MHSSSTTFIQPLLAPLVLMSTLGKTAILVEKILNNRKRDKKETVAISVTFEAQKSVQFIFILLNIHIEYP